MHISALWICLQSWVQHICRQFLLLPPRLVHWPSLLEILLVCEGDCVKLESHFALYGQHWSLFYKMLLFAQYYQNDKLYHNDRLEWLCSIGMRLTTEWHYLELVQIHFHDFLVPSVASCSLCHPHHLCSLAVAGIQLAPKSMHKKKTWQRIIIKVRKWCIFCTPIPPLQ